MLFRVISLILSPINLSGKIIYYGDDIISHVKDIINKYSWLTFIIPDLVCLHNALFVALQTGSQTLLVQTHTFFILKMTAVYRII